MCKRLKSGQCENSLENFSKRLSPLKRLGFTQMLNESNPFRPAILPVSLRPQTYYFYWIFRGKGIVFPKTPLWLLGRCGKCDRIDTTVTDLVHTTEQMLLSTENNAICHRGRHTSQISLPKKYRFIARLMIANPSLLIFNSRRAGNRAKPQ